MTQTFINISNEEHTGLTYLRAAICFLSVTVINTMTKCSLGQKGLFTLQFRTLLKGGLAGTGGRKPEAVPQGRNLQADNSR